MPWDSEVLHAQEVLIAMDVVRFNLPMTTPRADCRAYTMPRLLLCIVGVLQKRTLDVLQHQHNDVVLSEMDAVNSGARLTGPNDSAATRPKRQ